jgi:hypothetical protein
MAEYGLEVNFFAKTIDAAIGEHAPAQKRLAFPQVDTRAEIPGLNTFVPVASDVRDVAVFLGGYNKGELVPVVGIAEWCLRSDRDAIGSGRSSPERAVVGADDGNVAPVTGAPVSRRVTNTNVF